MHVIPLGVLRKRLRLRFDGDPFEPDPVNTGVGNADGLVKIKDYFFTLLHCRYPPATPTSMEER